LVWKVWYEEEQGCCCVEMVRMEGRRRGGCSGRRIVASKRGSGNGNGSGITANTINSNTNSISVIKKLQTREICSKPHRAFASATSPHRFRTMRLTQYYDSHDPSKSRSSLLPFLLKRTKVVEIVAAKNLIFALYHSGLCAAFSRGEASLAPFDSWFLGLDCHYALPVC